MNESRLHIKAWNEAMASTRNRVSMPLSNEVALDEWLKVHWPLLRDTALAEFEQMAASTGLSGRYIDYFIACVLSDHGGGTLRHSLPPEVGSRSDVPTRGVVQEVLFSSDGYYRVTYRPRLERPPGFRWEWVAPPRAFSVAWPNTGYHWPTDKDETLRIASSQNAACEIVLNRVGERLTWFHRQGWAIADRESGQLRDAPVLYDEAVVGRTVQEMLGLPDDVLVVRTYSAIPLVNFAGDTPQVYIRGGALMDRWRQPRVERDPSIDKADDALADKCEKVIQLLAGSLSGSGLIGGRTPTTRPSPGSSRREYAAQQYRKELGKLDHSPTERELWEIRDKVLRRAQRQFPAQEQPFEDEWHRVIDAEKPWLRR